MFVFFIVSDLYIFLSPYCLFYLKSFATVSFGIVSFDSNIFEQTGVHRPGPRCASNWWQSQLKKYKRGKIQEWKFLDRLHLGTRACPFMSTYGFGPSDTRYLLCHNNIIIWRPRYLIYYDDIINEYKFNIVKRLGLGLGTGNRESRIETVPVLTV